VLHEGWREQWNLAAVVLMERFVADMRGVKFRGAKNGTSAGRVVGYQSFMRMGMTYTVLGRCGHDANDGEGILDPMDVEKGCLHLYLRMQSDNQVSAFYE
jgi:hypothetical protein